MNDTENIWHLLEILNKGVLNNQHVETLKSRYTSMLELRNADPEDLVEFSNGEFGLSQVLEMINGAVADALLRNISDSDESDLTTAVRALAIEKFSKKTCTSMICFFFRNGNLVAMSEPNYGSLFKFVIYPRDIIADAFAADANEVLVAVNSPYPANDAEKGIHDSLEQLRHSGEALNIMVRDSIFLSVRRPGELKDQFKTREGLRQIVV